jgi:hypothetical protein
LDENAPALAVLSFIGALLANQLDLATNEPILKTEFIFERAPCAICLTGSGANRKSKPTSGPEKPVSVDSLE